MRIYDTDGDKALNEICIYLTLEEAQELRAGLSMLIKDPAKHHDHVSDADCKKKLTVAVYAESNIDQFDQRSRRLIEEDR